MGKPADDVVAGYGNDGKEEIEVKLVSIQEGMKKISEGGWYLDRYRSALQLEETGALPNDQIYIVNNINEANRRFDVKSKTWAPAPVTDGK
jgi:hypothetical protein